METYKHYKSSRKRLAEFISTNLRRLDISVQSIDYKFLDAFDVFIKKDFNNVRNTAWNYHKHLKRVLNLSVSLDYIDKNPYSKFNVGLDKTQLGHKSHQAEMHKVLSPFINVTNNLT